jgi:polyhydroxyalkanoate synthesis regulator phasin
MANATLKREEGKSPYGQGAYTTSQNSANDEEILNSFQSIEADEARLSEQKEHLTILLNQLEIKAKEEFEKRKQKVERLNSEVSDLKRKCEKLANWVNSESALES